MGATLAGIAFVIPSFIMVVLIGMAYVHYDGLPWMQNIFYGVGAAVIGIISMSAYKLTTKSVSKLNVESVQKNYLLWLLFIAAGIVTVVTQTENIFIFIAFCKKQQKD